MKKILAILIICFATSLVLSGPVRRQAKEEVEARQVIAELNLTPAQIQIIKDYFTADVDVVFSGLSAAQRKFLKTQQTLVKVLIKREVKELRD